MYNEMMMLLVYYTSYVLVVSMHAARVPSRDDERRSRTGRGEGLLLPPPDLDGSQFQVDTAAVHDNSVVVVVVVVVVCGRCRLLFFFGRC